MQVGSPEILELAFLGDINFAAQGTRDTKRPACRHDSPFRAAHETTVLIGLVEFMNIFAGRKVHARNSELVLEGGQNAYEWMHHQAFANQVTGIGQSFGTPVSREQQ